jgi:hypothetical protein
MTVRITPRTARDFGLAIGIGVIACLVELVILSGSGALLTGLFLGGAAGAIKFLVFALPVGTLAITVLVGIRTGRMGLVFGAASFVVVLLLLFGGASYYKADVAQQTEERARALDRRIFSPLEAKHAVIAVEGNGACDSICIQILAQTNYAFAAKSQRSREWTLYRRIEGGPCLLAENARAHLDFLKAGYVGLCAGKSEWLPADDAIFVVAAENDHRRTDAIVGPPFKGQVFEAYERRGGQDRLLGRWLSGRVRYGKDPARIGESFEAEDFYSALLNVPIVHADSPGPADTDELLSELEPLVDDAQLARDADAFLGRDAAYTYRSFAVKAGDAERPAVQRYLRSLFESGRRERILLGLSVVAQLRNWPAKDREFARAAIVKAMGSEDDEVTTNALYALNAFRPEDWAFAHAAFWELTFSPLLRDGSSDLLNALMSRLEAMHVPSDVRDRAKALLLSDSALFPNQRAVFIAIVSQGE